MIFVQCALQYATEGSEVSVNIVADELLLATYVPLPGNRTWQIYIFCERPEKFENLEY